MPPHPPPINTASYPQGHPALGGAPQPPVYQGGGGGVGGGYGVPGGMHGGTMGGYGRAPVEADGSVPRSKAQLIVGIDFVSHVLYLTQGCLLT